MCAHSDGCASRARGPHRAQTQGSFTRFEHTQFAADAGRLLPTARTLILLGTVLVVLLLLLLLGVVVWGVEKGCLGEDAQHKTVRARIFGLILGVRGARAVAVARRTRIRLRTLLLLRVGLLDGLCVWEKTGEETSLAAQIWIKFVAWWKVFVD